MRPIWRNEDNQDNSGKSGLEPRLLKCYAIGQAGPLPRGPGLRGRNPTAGVILRAKEFFLVSKCFYFHDSTWSTLQP